MGDLLGFAAQVCGLQRLGRRRVGVGRFHQRAQAVGCDDGASVAIREQRARRAPLHARAIDAAPLGLGRRQPVRPPDLAPVGGDDDQKRLLDRPPVALVAPETAGPLDQQVGGRKVGDHQVEVAVERLLQHLRGDDHATRSPLAIATESADHVALDGEPVA